MVVRDPISMFIVHSSCAHSVYKKKAQFFLDCHDPGVKVFFPVPWSYPLPLPASPLSVPRFLRNSPCLATLHPLGSNSASAH